MQLLPLTGTENLRRQRLSALWAMQLLPLTGTENVGTKAPPASRSSMQLLPLTGTENFSASVRVRWVLC